ncbi:MAG: hypothetical protein ACFCBW_12030 [Candidatus Competibacterales bacterium]
MTNHLLTGLQRHLEGIYELGEGLDVAAFTVTDVEWLTHVDPGARGDSAVVGGERLLVRQADDELQLALYLDPAVLSRLADDDPWTHLHDGNLADYCTALEGVSHFRYLCWNAGHGRPVTALELEMQAEVDKYIAVATLLGRQGAGRVPRALRPRLFDEPQFHAGLSKGLTRRYYDANRYADRYVRHLEDAYLRRATSGEATLVRDLRRFYRLSLRDKIRRIEAVA